MYEPPPQVKDWGWVWPKWIYGFWNNTVSLDGGQTITGDLTISGTVIIMDNLPTSDPLNAGQLWNNAGVLTVSAG